MASDLAMVLGLTGLKKSRPAFWAVEMGEHPVAWAPWIYQEFSNPSLENSW